MRWTALLLLVAAVRGGDGDAVMLKARWKAPEQTSTMLKVVRTTSGLHDTGQSVETTTIVYGEKVDELKGGRPARLRRKYSRYETKTQTIFADTDLGAEVKQHPLAGKVVSFKLRDGVLAPTKAVPPGSILSAEWHVLLPAQAVTVGETWTCERCATFERITSVKGARIQGTLVSLAPKKGQAEIGLAGAGFEGTMVFSTRHGKVLRLSLAGKTKDAAYEITCERRSAAGK